MRKKHDSRQVLMFTVGVFLLIVANLVFAEKKSVTTTAPVDPPKTKAQIAAIKYGDYLIKMFSDHLKRSDWIARSMAVISLSRIDDPRVTKILLDVLAKDRKPIVRLFAWEALHARHKELNPKERAQWKKQGFLLDDKDAFRGEMRLPIVRLMAEDGPTSPGKNRFKKIFLQTNSLVGSDIRVIQALGETLKAWKSPDLTRTLINLLSDKSISSAYRAELVLQQMIPEGTIPRAYEFGKNKNESIRLASSNEWWSQTQKVWQEWLRENKKDLRQVSAKDLKPYAGTSKIMPKPQAITESNYKAWKNDLELKKFTLGQLDITFVLDTTATMSNPMVWLKHDMERMMKAFELISREPRVSLICYRDEGDQYVAKKTPFTSKIQFLIDYLGKEDARGGGADVPEAVYEGLFLAIKKQKWVGANSRRAIILIGDAPPKKDSLGKLESLLKEASHEHFVVSSIKVRIHSWVKHGLKDDYDPHLKTFDEIAKWGNGSSVLMEFSDDIPYWLLMASSNPEHFRNSSTASPDAVMCEKLIFQHTLTACLKDDYRDRVGPFVSILLEYCNPIIPEHRKAFPSRKPWKKSPWKKKGNKQLER